MLVWGKSFLQLAQTDTCQALQKSLFYCLTPELEKSLWLDFLLLHHP